MITEPVRLALVPDMEALRVRMGTAQAKIAQEPDATKGGKLRWKRWDVAHVVMSACRFGCDELYERGYITVGDNGQVIFSHAIEASEHARAYVVQHLKGKFFGQPMAGRASYFTWHRENKFLDPV